MRSLATSATPKKIRRVFPTFMTSDIFTVIAFDYGEKRIGVAVGQTLSATAEPLVVLEQKNRQIDWAAIKALMEDWRPDQLLVGFPHTADGKEIPIHLAIKTFSEELGSRFNLPVAFCDEHLSSYQAKQSPLAVKAAKRSANKRHQPGGKNHARKRRRDTVGIDAIAAQMILESWLESRL